MSVNYRLDGKVALVMGGAGGIGKALVEGLSRQGAKVVISDFNTKAQDETAKKVAAETGNEVIGISCDVTKEETVAAMVKQVVEKYGTIDILVNAVGGSTIVQRPSATVEELSLDEWKKLIDFNLDATFLFTHAIVPIMKRQKSGKIVNLASVAGRGRSVASSSAYAAAKGGIIAFTKKLCYELGPYGININAIAPSVTLTERIRPHWERRSQEDQAREIDKTPLRRVAEAVDQAKVICFLASSDADFVTGVTIDVTGGG